MPRPSELGLFFTVGLFWVSIVQAGSPTVPSAQGDVVVEIQSVQVGVEGFYKNGLWTPILVQWSCRGAGHETWTESSVRFSVSSVDSDGMPILYRDADTSTTFRREENESIARSMLYAKLGRQNGLLTVQLHPVDGGTFEWKQRPSGNPVKQSTATATRDTSRFFEPISSEKPIYLIVGNENIGLQAAIAELSLGEEQRPVLVKIRSLADMPDRWFGLESVEMIVLTTTEPEQFAGMTMQSPQIRAIDEWIRMGGRLFFCAGKNSEDFLEPENGALRPFLPGEYEKMDDLKDGRSIVRFIGSKRNLFLHGNTDEHPPLRMPTFKKPRGIVFANELDQVLVSRCAHGWGTIIYFGGDLSGKPLGNWRDRTELVRHIMQWNTEKRIVRPHSTSLIQLGYGDISGQIRSSLDRFDSVRILPFSLVLVLAAVYWLVVGPLDWFLVRKVLKKPMLTWITFPLWIALFGALAYGIAAQGRPNKAMLNELTLVDMDSETGVMRTSSWANLYSPRDARYSLQWKNTENVPTFSLLSWNGLPGGGLGGMAPKTVSPTVWQTGAVQELFASSGNSADSSIDDVPIQIRSTKSFYGQSWLPDPESQSAPNLRISAQLRDEEGIPMGRLSFPDTMPVLKDCMMVYGRWIQELGTVEPGKTIELGKNTPRRELSDLLISPEAPSERKLQGFSSFNTQSTDGIYIARVLSFYGALGAFDAVGLSNAYQRSLDLSDLFSVDRAFLIGTVQENTAFPVGIGGRDLEIRQQIVFRQAFPIELVKGISPRLGYVVENTADGLGDIFNPAGAKEGYNEFSPIPKKKE